MLSLGLIPGVEVAQIFQNINEDGTEVIIMFQESSSIFRKPLTHLFVEERTMLGPNWSRGVSFAVVLVSAPIVARFLEISCEMPMWSVFSQMNIIQAVVCRGSDRGPGGPA